MVFQSGSVADRYPASPVASVEPYSDIRRDIPDANNLITTFILSAAIVLLIGMLLFGTWVTQRSADAVLEHSANSAAIFMDSSIEPLIQDLATSPNLSPASIDALDKLLTHEAIRQKFSSITIWKTDGTIAYAKDRSLIGSVKPATPGLASALKGDVEIELLGSQAGIVTEVMPNEQDSYRIYSPLHKLQTTEVIAVGGYTEPPQKLDSVLAQGRRDTWVVVGVFTILIFGLTFNLIHHASEMIKQQNVDLRDRYAAQVRLNLQNELLRKELQDAHREGISINENFLRRISADLHDGPAQFLALALLRLDDINSGSSTTNRAGDADRRLKALETVRSATHNALSEIRSISTGLALPEITDRSPADVIGLAINTFVAATQTKVVSEIGQLPEHLPTAWNVCLFRFVQECLSNAYRHAGGQGLAVRARSFGGMVEVEVSDQGPGFDPDAVYSTTSRLGLLGLRHRIESLGGSFTVTSAPGKGTVLFFGMPLSELGEPQ